MMGRGRRQLLKSVDRDRVVEAIRQAELRTSGEIRVSVSRFFWGNVRRTAEKAFFRMGMTKTQNRNAVLFFIVPSRRSFAVLGDAGIHGAVGQEFWDSLAVILGSGFRKKAYTEALVEAIGAAGDKLASSFPYDGATDVNELPDDVDFCSS